MINNDLSLRILYKICLNFIDNISFDQTFNMVYYTCSVCNENVSKTVQSIKCDVCLKWCHRKCRTGMFIIDNIAS